MELPGKTQGNPDGSLWAADVAHSVQKPLKGEGAVVETQISVCLTEGLSSILHYRKICQLIR